MHSGQKKINVCNNKINKEYLRNDILVAIKYEVKKEPRELVFNKNTYKYLPSYNSRHFQLLPFFN